MKKRGLTLIIFFLHNGQLLSSRLILYKLSSVISEILCLLMVSIKHVLQKV